MEEKKRKNSTDWGGIELWPSFKISQCRRNKFYRTRLCSWVLSGTSNGWSSRLYHPSPKNK